MSLITKKYAADIEKGFPTESNLKLIELTSLIRQRGSQNIPEFWRFLFHIFLKFCELQPIVNPDFDKIKKLSNFFTLKFLPRNVAELQHVKIFASIALISKNKNIFFALSVLLD